MQSIATMSVVSADFVRANIRRLVQIFVACYGGASEWSEPWSAEPWNGERTSGVHNAEAYLIGTLLERGSQFRVAFADDGAQILGFSVSKRLADETPFPLRVVRDERAPIVAGDIWLQELAVDPESQRCGTGTELLLAEEMGAEAGQRVHVRIAASAARARAFCSRHGYETGSAHSVWTMAGRRDAQLCSKELGGQDGDLRVSA